MEKKRQSYNFVAVRGGSNPEGGGAQAEVQTLSA